MLKPLQHGVCLDQEEMKTDGFGEGYYESVVLLEGFLEFLFPSLFPQEDMFSSVLPPSAACLPPCRGHVVGVLFTHSHRQVSLSDYEGKTLTKKEGQQEGREPQAKNRGSLPFHSSTTSSCLSVLM